MDDILVVILNFNKPEITAKSIKSLLQVENKIPHILVIDNGSEIWNFQKLLNFCEPLGFHLINAEEVGLMVEKPARIIHRNNRNLGYSAGNNVGLRYGLRMGYKYTAIVNNDIIFIEPVFNILRETLERFPDVAVVAPRVLDAFGRVQIPNFPLRRTTFFETILYPFFYYLLMRFKDRERLKRLVDSELTYVLELSGCFLLFKSDVFEKIGFLDENVFLYGEERIIFDNLERVGLRGMVNNKVKVLHAHEKSKESFWGELPFKWSNYWKYSLKSQLYYVEYYRGFKGFRKYLIGIFTLAGWIFAGIMRFYIKFLMIVFKIRNTSKMALNATG